jgi:NADH-quinone oxidoreductase subunit B
MSAQMEIGGRTTVMPNRELVAPRGAAGAGIDPFFTNVNSELSDMGFLVAAADALIAWARTGVAHVDAVRTRLLRD